VPPTVQSSRFFSEPGRVPAYSGVQNSTASAEAKWQSAEFVEAARVLPEMSRTRCIPGFTNSHN